MEEDKRHMKSSSTNRTEIYVATEYDIQFYRTK